MIQWIVCSLLVFKGLVGVVVLGSDVVESCSRESPCEDGIDDIKSLLQKSPQNQFGTSCPYTESDATDLLITIQNVVSFYEKSYAQITMRNDGGVGLGVLRGQLSYILEEKKAKLPKDVQGVVQHLHEVSGPLALKIFDLSIEAVTDVSKKYGALVIRNHTDILQARYKDWHDTSVIGKHFGEFDKIGNEKEVVYPYLDFHCLVTLVEDCNVPEVCRKMYLERPYSQYMLMHQVIYQQFATRRDCFDVTEENQEAFGNAQEFQDRLCAKAYLEAEFLEKHAFPTRFIDLFAEQVGFCGLLGYPNFLKSSWLRQILSWQTGRSGCFPDHYGETKTTDAIIQGEFGSEGESEDCLVHLTSVSLMALSLNFRYLVDTCSPDILDGYESNI